MAYTPSAPLPTTRAVDDPTWAALHPIENAPVSTISGSTATQNLQSVVTPTLTAAQQAINTQKADLANAETAKLTAPVLTQEQQDKAAGTTSTYGYTNGVRNPAPTGSTDGGDSELSALMERPTEGYQFAYQPDGTRLEIPLGTTAAQYGMSDVQPSATLTAAAKLQQAGGINTGTTVPLDDQSKVARLNDGTYAQLDENGNFLKNISADEYATMRQSSNVYQKNILTQETNAINDKMTQVTNGTYPLQPWQVDQLNGIKSQYASLVAEQKIANANREGGEKTLQGLLGMSEYSPGNAMGSIKAVIDQGISKVASLNAELASTVGKMTQAFQTDNFNMLKTLYDQHEKAVENRQSAIDKMAEAVAKAKKEADDLAYKREVDKADEAYRQATLELSRDTLSFNEKKDLLDNALAQTGLDETKRHNIATEKEAMLKRQQEAQANYFDPKTPFASTIGNIAQGVSRLDRGNFMADMSDVAKSGDYKTLLTRMTNKVSESLPAADRTKLSHHETAVDYLNKMEAALTQYKAEGGDTGLLKGTYGEITAKLGQLTTDPKYRELATMMNDNFVRFRAEVTGAAFSEAESRGYAALMPTGDKNVDLNLSTIKGARDFAQQQIDAMYTKKMGDGYKQIEGLAKQQDTYEEVSQMTEDDAAAELASIDNDKIRDEATAMVGTKAPNGQIWGPQDALLFAREQMGL